MRDSPIFGKTVLFLGSSVTYGECAGGVSFVELLAQQDGIIPVKEAVSGTTLADVGGESYVARLKRMDGAVHADAFVCQLSTNDATQQAPLGCIAEGHALEAFDVRTVTGAAEYVTAYARQTWGCPVIFYTGVRYDSPAYRAMVERLWALQRKWGIVVLDLFNDPAMNDITEEAHRAYMADAIHPTLAGYREWWLPRFEACLAKAIGN